MPPLPTSPRNPLTRAAPIPPPLASEDLHLAEGDPLRTRDCPPHGPEGKPLSHRRDRVQPSALPHHHHHATRYRCALEATSRENCEWKYGEHYLRTKAVERIPSARLSSRTLSSVEDRGCKGEAF
ncbi:hypothetical protein B0T16DRAFT_396773 [Cercophora newfieldiana]|uniref:Uncharacterized protein n=1 Tax=Cercophora newfieldiana TaxID=92897 RepID=A0AA40CYN6_9PEZI|nr:hypothetical protein B0T16DRAFT_396773 [Cercophora newfieldiana]